jgi:hypothetical protein
LHAGPSAPPHALEAVLLWPSYTSQQCSFTPLNFSYSSPKSGMFYAKKLQRNLTRFSKNEFALMQAKPKKSALTHFFLSAES